MIENMTQAKAALDAMFNDDDSEPSVEVKQNAARAGVFILVDIADSLRAIAGRADD